MAALVPAERLPEVKPDDLRIAWLTLLNRAAVNQHHKVTREQLSVRSHMSAVLRRLLRRRARHHHQRQRCQPGV